jgi:hypothetical protein
MIVLIVSSLASKMVGSAQYLSGAYGVPLVPSTAPVVGSVPADIGIALSVGLPVQNNVGLQALIVRVSDLKSPQFRWYISPNNFNTTYGATVGNYQALQAWAAVAVHHDCHVL